VVEYDIASIAAQSDPAGHVTRVFRCERDAVVSCLFVDNGSGDLFVGTGHNYLDCYGLVYYFPPGTSPLAPSTSYWPGTPCVGSPSHVLCVHKPFRSFSEDEQPREAVDPHRYHFITQLIADQHILAAACECGEVRVWPFKSAPPQPWKSCYGYDVHVDHPSASMYLSQVNNMKMCALDITTSIIAVLSGNSVMCYKTNIQHEQITMQRFWQVDLNLTRTNELTMVAAFPRGIFVSVGKVMFVYGFGNLMSVEKCLCKVVRKNPIKNVVFLPPKAAILYFEPEWEDESLIVEIFIFDTFNEL